MDFSAYKAQNRLGTPADRTSNVRISNPGAEALAQQQAKAGAIFTNGLDRLRAEVQTGRIMQANNEYNKEMLDLTNELRQNKEQDALNTVEQFDEREQKIRSRIQKKYGSFLYGEAGRRYEDMLMRDYNSRRQSMINYQIGEAEKFNDTTLKNGLNDVMNLATADYTNPDNVDGAMNKAAHLVAMRYEHYGEEKIKQMTRVAQGNMAGMLVNTAISMNDWSGANDLLQRYGAAMDPEKRSKLSQLVTERIQTERNTVTLAALAEQYSDLPSFIAAAEKLYDDSHIGGADGYVMPTQGTNIDEQVRQLTPEFRSALPQIGGILKYKFGMDAVISSGGRTYEHQMEINPSAPNSHHIIRERGGDAVDIVLPDNVTDAQAKAVRQYFEKSGAFKEVLFHDAGSGYHLHLGGYNGGLAQKASPMERRKFVDNAIAEWNRHKHLVNLQQEETYKGMNQELMALRDAGNATWNDYTNCVERIAGGDAELRQKGYAAAKYWYNQVTGGRENPWSSGSGGSKGGLAIGAMHGLEETLMHNNFENESDWSALVISQNPNKSEYDRLMDLYHQKKKGEGIFKYNWEGLKENFKKRNHLPNATEIVFWRNAKAYAIDEINRIREREGREATVGEVEDLLDQSLKKVHFGEIESGKWYVGNQSVDISYGELAGRGIERTGRFGYDQIEVDYGGGRREIVNAERLLNIVSPAAVENDRYRY